jgi:hypothetical protein
VSLYLDSVGLALRCPRTIPHLVRAAWAFRVRRWRLETAYGSAEARPSDDEMERYLSWTTRMRREMRRRRHGA